MDFNRIRDRVINYPITGINLYYLSFLALYVISFLKMTTYADFVSPNWLSRLSYLFVGLILVKIYLFDDFNIRRFLANTIFLGTAFIVWRNTRAFDIVICASLILGARNVDFKAIMQWFFKLGLLMIIFTIISSQAGVIKDLKYLRSGVVRHSLGVNYPTDFGAHILYLILAYCYLEFRKLTWKSYGLIMLIAIVLMQLTQARLDVYAIILTIIVVKVAQVARTRQGTCRQVTSFLWILPAIMSYVTVISAYFYSSTNQMFDSANHILSERLHLSHLAMERYGVHLFGNRVIEHGFGGTSGYHVFNQMGMGKEYFYIDSSLLRLFVIYGLIVAVLIIGVMTVISLQSIIGHDYRMAAIIAIVTVSALIEPHLLDISFNPFLISLLAMNVANGKTPTTEV